MFRVDNLFYSNMKNILYVLIFVFNVLNIGSYFLKYLFFTLFCEVYVISIQFSWEDTEIYHLII